MFIRNSPEQTTLKQMITKWLFAVDERTEVFVQKRSDSHGKKAAAKEAEVINESEEISSEILRCDVLS